MKKKWTSTYGETLRESSSGKVFYKGEWITKVRYYGIKKSIAAAKAKYERYEKEQEAKRKIEEKEAIDMIDNLEDYMELAVAELRGSTIQFAGEQSKNAIIEMIEESVSTWGYISTARKLKKWAVDFREKIKRLVQAVINTNGANRYNTNSFFLKRDDKGATGRANYEKDIRKLATILKVPPVIIASL